MITLKSFHNQSLKNNIPFEKIRFSKNNFNKKIKGFLIQLSEHIGIFIFKIHKLKKVEELDDTLLNTLSSIEKFYSFLKENQSEIQKYNCSYSSIDSDISEQIYKKYNVGEYYKEYTSSTEKLFFTHLGLHQKSETIIFDECMRQLYQGCIEILALIIFLNNNVCKKEDIGNILFDIQFELHSHLVPNHFEDLDSYTLGLISQIKLLKK